MKKFAVLTASVMMAMAVSACGSTSTPVSTTAAATTAAETTAAATTAAATTAAETTAAAEETTAPTGPQTCTYTVYNTTGENVTELYVYAAGSSDKGTNYAESGLKSDASVEVSETMDASETEKAVFTLEYKTESGREGSFNTLHFETVPISQIAEDAMTGATPIAFQAPASK